MSHTTNHPEYNYTVVRQFTVMTIVWGIVGMFLSVPILVLVTIVCAHIPSWRWIAILLSRDGQIGMSRASRPVD